MEISLGQLPKLFTLKDERLWHYRGFCLRVIDGDTALIIIDRGMHNYALEKVRLAGIDAPEHRPRVGSPAQREAEKELAAQATARLIELIGGKEILVRTEKTGKFGRWLATLFLPEDHNKSANQVLLDEGLAVVYGKPRPWRDE